MTLLSWNTLSVTVNLFIFPFLSIALFIKREAQSSVPPQDGSIRLSVCVYAFLRARESAWEFLISPFRGVASCTARLSEASWRGRTCASLPSPRRLFALEPQYLPRPCNLLIHRSHLCNSNPPPPPHPPPPPPPPPQNNNTHTHTHTRPLKKKKPKTKRKTNKFWMQACHNSI